MTPETSAATETPTAGFAVKTLSGSFGAEVRGLDLSNLDKDGFEQAYQLMVEHKVVVFRDQHFDLDSYEAFAGRWGRIHKHPFMRGMDNHPGILDQVGTDVRRHQDDGVSKINGSPLAVSQSSVIHDLKK